MFTAKTKNNRMISLVDTWEKIELEKLSNTEELFCPACQERVQIKLGNKRLWHFAHVSKENCKLQQENESEYHMQGKKKLYYWLRSQGIAGELEVYIPKIKQRPDLLVQWNNHHYAIEFQCSTIKADELLKRTRFYRQEKIKPIWILGGTRLKRGSQNIIRPSSFDLLMSMENKLTGFNLVYFCPTTERFFIASTLLPFTATTFISKTAFYPTNEQSFSFSTILQCNNNDSVDFLPIWLGLKKRWRSNSFLYKRDHLSRWFYEKGVPLCLLPAEAGIPTKSMIWIKTDVILWQGWILLNCIYPLKIGEHITFQEVYKTFKAEVQKGNFIIRSLPYCQNSHYSFAIMEYLQQLAQIGVLKMMGNKTTFQKARNIIIPINIETACKEDEKVGSRHF